MNTATYTYWQDGEHWLGFLNEFSDYTTQGESLQNLQEHLADLHREFTCGQLPRVRCVGELTLQ